MRVEKHNIVFTKERYSSYEVEKILMDFGTKLTTAVMSKNEMYATFEHKGMVSKKQDYIN